MEIGERHICCDKTLKIERIGINAKINKYESFLTLSNYTRKKIYQNSLNSTIIDLQLKKVYKKN